MESPTSISPSFLVVNGKTDGDENPAVVATAIASADKNASCCVSIVSLISIWVHGIVKHAFPALKCNLSKIR